MLRSMARERLINTATDAIREWDEDEWRGHMNDARINRPETYARAVVDAILSTGGFDLLMDLAQAILDRNYPAYLPLVNDRNSPDPGPRLAAALGDCLAARRERDNPGWTENL